MSRLELTIYLHLKPFVKYMRKAVWAGWRLVYKKVMKAILRTMSMHYPQMVKKNLTLSPLTHLIDALY